MRRRTVPFLGFAALALAVAADPGPSNRDDRPTDPVSLPRVAIAGLAIECSTFSPARSQEGDFQIRAGDEVFDAYPFLAAGTPLRDRAVWLPALVARALPGGRVTRAAYESLVARTLERLAQHLPYDGLFLDIHGAMSVEGVDDPEGDYLARVRAVTGHQTVISTCMDLHGNVSWRLAHQTDLITCFRLAPHEDALESRERAVVNLLARLAGGVGKPLHKAWVPVPILLPGEKTSTRVEPARGLYGRVGPVSRLPGVVDAGVWVGYAWADEPRNHAVVMVVGDDRRPVMAAAEELARHFWAVRRQFEFVAPTADLAECLDRALASPRRPFLISDMGDNPTAGGAGDVTWTLGEILARPEFRSPSGPRLIYASLPGPELVRQAVRVGVGGEVDALAGAAVDDRFAPPIRLTGDVTAIAHGDPHAETEVVVRVGQVDVIVTHKRKPYHRESDFTRLGLDPRAADIVVVKIGYLVPDLYALQADWVMALTPGGVDQDLTRLPYQRVVRPLFPLDPDMPDPDLRARRVPLSHEPVGRPETGGRHE